MRRVDLVANGIYHFVAPRLKAATCSVFLVAGERSALVETGPAAMTEHVLEGLRMAGCDPATIAYVIPTHIHLDHGGGAGDILQYLPNARLVVHERGASHLIDPSRLIASTKRAYGDDFEKDHGPISPVPLERMWVVKGGEEVDLGNRKLSVLYTPGHAPHHISLVDSLSRGVFAGEALGLYHHDLDLVSPAVTPPNFDMEDYSASIRKISSLDPPVVFFSHSGPSTGVQGLVRNAERTLQELADLVLVAMREQAEVKEVERRIERYFFDLARLGGNPGRRTAFNSPLLAGGFMMYFQKEGRG